MGAAESAARAPGNTPAGEGGGAAATDEGITVVSCAPSMDTITTATQHHLSESDAILHRLQQLRPSEPLLNSPFAAQLLELSLVPSPGDMSGGGATGIHADTHTFTGSGSGTAAFLSWHRAATNKMVQNQDELHCRMEAVEALAAKVQKRIHWTSSVANSSVVHLREVSPLRQEMAQMKEEMKKVMANFEGLCLKLDEHKQCLDPGL